MDKVNALQLSMSDRLKIEETVEREKGRLFNFIRKSVSSIEDAEDILQDVFYQLAAGYNTIQSVFRLFAWRLVQSRGPLANVRAQICE